MSQCFVDYYKVAPLCCKLTAKEELSGCKGYFRFGEDAVCYGAYYSKPPAGSAAGPLHDAFQDISNHDGNVCLPFDLSEVIENLRCELYTVNWRDGRAKSTLARMYYSARPLLPVRVRSLIKRFHLCGWRNIRFPRWPVDCSVDKIFEQLLLLAVKAEPSGEVPFIWFWPQGADSAVMMTHDVETEAGLDFCPSLMDIDDSFGFKASFQIVPEQRYTVAHRFLDLVRDRGFEVAVHDLNHDGHLYRDREQFLERVRKINTYGKQYKATGFRAGVLYRKQLWYDALDFAYDMSVPNVAHLDPQRGGCCTVMPYFIGKILELPVTATQDYMLFHILGDYSVNLWKRQIDLIMGQYGLISFIVHPDYIISRRERQVYEDLLGYLNSLRGQKNLWIATPGEVNEWWRQRSKMTIVEGPHGLRIEGTGCERARIAYAREENGKLTFTWNERSNEAADLAGVKVSH